MVLPGAGTGSPGCGQIGRGRYEGIADTIVQLILMHPPALMAGCIGELAHDAGRGSSNDRHTFRQFRVKHNSKSPGGKFMSSKTAEVAIEAGRTAPNPLDLVPDEIPFDVPYGPPISLGRALGVIDAAVREPFC